MLRNVKIDHYVRKIWLLKILKVTHILNAMIAGRTLHGRYKGAVRRSCGRGLGAVRTLCTRFYWQI